MILTVTANPAIDKVYFVNEFKMGNLYRPDNICVSAGGKGLNVSRVASILGEPVTAMGFLGGSSGNFILEEVKKLGIIANFTSVSGETRTNINISDRTGCSGELLEPGPAITPNEQETFFVQFDKSVESCDIICISGSLPLGLDSSFYCRLIDICKHKSKPVIVDTSGDTLQDVVNHKPFMIKPNIDEVSQFMGFTPKTNSDIKYFLQTLKAKGIRVPFVTLGKDGAAAYVENHYYRFEIPSVDIKNAVGSGDSTVAGIAVGICKGLPLLPSLQLGMAVGIANTQFEQTGIVTTDLVKEYYGQIKISAF